MTKIHNHFTDKYSVGSGSKSTHVGSRKFTLDYMTRDDLAALTPEAAKISGIPYVMDLDAHEAEKILKS